MALFNEAARAKVPLIADRLEEQLVDGESRPCSLRRRDDGELHVARNITGYEHARYAGLARIGTAYSSVLAELASKVFEQRRSRVLAGIEEQGAPRKFLAVMKLNFTQAAALAVQLAHRVLTNTDATFFETPMLCFRQRFTVGAKDHVIGPLANKQG
jgi:hypothetical protein